MPDSITHNQTESRFETTVDGYTSVCDYTLADNQIILTHTFVPDELRGKGIAGQLVKAALDYTKANKFQAVPQCSYVDVYIQRHPEYADLLEDPK